MLSTPNGKLADFWAPALGLTAEPVDDKFLLTDGDDAHRLWINPVPNPRRSSSECISICTWRPLRADRARCDGSQRHSAVDGPGRPRGRESVRLRPRAGTPPGLPPLRGGRRLRRSGGDCWWWAEQFGVPAQHDQDEGFSWLAEAPWSAMGDDLHPECPNPYNGQEPDPLGWCGATTAPLVAAGSRVLREPGGDIFTGPVMADPSCRGIISVFSPPRTRPHGCRLTFSRPGFDIAVLVDMLRSTMPSFRSGLRRATILIISTAGSSRTWRRWPAIAQPAAAAPDAGLRRKLNSVLSDNRAGKAGTGAGRARRQEWRGALQPRRQQGSDCGVATARSSPPRPRWRR